ncbi:hypothetical protein [Caulobacter sp. DWR2-3-1b2]|uniref:hypothetical protein n=1 Tax=unclassified Caulobacter TaxID=2648921 RepID=UPI003CFA279D
MEQGFTLFETPIGLCGLTWNDRGLIGAQLPEAAPGVNWTRLRRRYPDAVEASPPPPAVQRTIERARVSSAPTLFDMAFSVAPWRR